MRFSSRKIDLCFAISLRNMKILIIKAAAAAVAAKTNNLFLKMATDQDKK